MFLRASGCTKVPDVRALRREFGLSPAEADVAVAIFQGREVNRIAQDRGASRETVRTQIRRVFVKLDVHNQAQAGMVIVRSLSMLLTR